MNDVSDTSDVHQGSGALDQEGRRQAVPVGEARAGRTEERHRAVRARLVDGVAADLRSAGAGPAELVGDGVFRRARLRHLVRSTWRATAAPPRTAASTPRSPRAPTTSRPAPTTSSRPATTPARCWSTASRRARCARRCSRSAIPNRVRRLALDAHVWTGEGSPTLAERKKKLPEFLKTKRRPIDRKFVRSIFERDHPGTADDNVIEAFADHILELDDSIPNGTYIDMCNNLPVVDPTKIKVPTIIMRGEYDGIAGFEDLLNFFEALPNPDKQFAVMPGIAHASLQQKNYMIALHILHELLHAAGADLLDVQAGQAAALSRRHAAERVPGHRETDRRSRTRRRMLKRRRTAHRRCRARRARRPGLRAGRGRRRQGQGRRQGGLVHLDAAAAGARRSSTCSRRNTASRSRCSAPAARPCCAASSRRSKPAASPPTC